MYAKVLIEYSVKKLDKEFIYMVPNELTHVIKVGMRVMIPFGNQTIAGFVVDLLSSIESVSYELKYIIDIIDTNIYLDKELMDLGTYLSDVTMCSKIAAYQAMLPAGLKVKKNSKDYNLYEDYISIKEISKVNEYIKTYENKRKGQVKVLKDLIKLGDVKKNNFSVSLVKSLLNEGLIEIKKVHKYRINKENSYVKKDLTTDQLRIFNRVVDSFNKNEVFLLYGITGSGKTEVYIKLIEEVLSRGQTGIVLVPEISLTHQIAKRFYESFGSNVAILHSSLSLGEKYDEYLKIYRGDVRVVVGTRSAVFAPLKNLGIIIIDEEDSSSYKQDNNPRYHARDIAIFRGKYLNIPVILGSATPSLDTKARADKNVYTLLTLNKRVNDAVLPNITVVDMEEEMKKRRMIFSYVLKRKIEEKINMGEQVILLLNRRGFSTFITCSNCGFTYKCPSCDITLTYHKSTNNLICHYCGYQKKCEEKCPKCQENALNYYGLGTEKLEEKIKTEFLNAKVVRMDQDTTKGKGSHEKIIEDFKNEKYNILLGTQMISKGLDFPKVTLVGVINADTSLNIPNFKASENTFALLHQVAGRSGRSKYKGEVVIQTFNPDNYVIKCVKENSYDRFYLEEMNFRKKLKYPPYYYLVGIKVIGSNYDKTLENSKKAKDYLSNNLKDAIVLGPTTASVFKFNNEYRMQIIIKYKYCDNLKIVLKELDNIFIFNKDARIEIDFNPINI